MVYLSTRRNVCKVVTSEYEVEFLSCRPNRFFPSNIPLLLARWNALTWAVQDLLRYGVNIPVPLLERFQGSNFLVPKEDGVRPIL